MEEDEVEVEVRAHEAAEVQDTQITAQGGTMATTEETEPETEGHQEMETQEKTDN